MYYVLSVLSETETGNQLVNLLEELETGKGGSVQDMRVQWEESEAVLGDWIKVFGICILLSSNLNLYIAHSACILFVRSLRSTQ